MNFTAVYNMFVRDFRRQRRRVTLTLVALAWGTISIMLLLGFGEGIHNQMDANRSGLGDRIAILWPGATSIPYKGLGKGRQLSFEPEDVEYLRQSVPEITEVAGEYLRWGVEFKYKDKVISDLVSGIPPSFATIRNHIPRMGGRMINDLDVQLKRRVAFLGEEVKQRLFGDEDAVGKQFFLQGLPFTVIGVEIHKMQMGMYHGPDSRKISIPHTTFVAIFGDPFLDDIIYQIKDPDRAEAVERQVFEAFGAKKKFDPDDQQALWVWNTIEEAKEFNNMMTGINMFLGIIGSLTLLIACVGVANIMYVSIRERTREIGIKMATGARRSYILWQFLIEALMITFLGGASGMAFSYILTEAFKRVPIDSPVMEFMGRPTLSLEIGLLVTVILGFMGFLSGFFPALKAASIYPVESLRYE